MYLNISNNLKKVPMMNINFIIKIPSTINKPPKYIVGLS